MYHLFYHQMTSEVDEHDNYDEHMDMEEEKNMQVEDDLYILCSCFLLLSYCNVALDFLTSCWKCIFEKHSDQKKRMILAMINSVNMLFFFFSFNVRMRDGLFVETYERIFFYNCVFSLFGLLGMNV